MASEPTRTTWALHQASLAVRTVVDTLHLLLMSVNMHPKNPGAVTDIKLELERLAQELEDLANAK